MPQLQFISLAGRSVAVVVGGERAAIASGLDAQDQRRVEAMCVYAMQVADGERPGPYRDEDAERFALRALTRQQRAREHIRCPSRGG